MNIGYTLAAMIAFVGIPSICVLYGGKDTTRSLGLSWAVAAPASIMWGLIAFSMVFGKSISTGVIGDDAAGTINKIGGGDYSFVYYSFMYAMTALSIIIGGAGPGMKFGAFQLFMLGSLLLNYCPLAFWFWNMGATPGWGWSYGIIDYAGGMVLHGYAGTAVLILGLLSKGSRAEMDYGSVTSILAAIGFFVGKQALQVSSGGYDGAWSSLGAFNTIVAAYAGAVTYNLASYVLPKNGAPFKGTITSCSSVKGALVGTVAMAAGAAYLEPEYAVLSTVCSATIVYLIDHLTKGINVAGFDCFVTHGVSGFVGSAMIGLFANNKDGRLYVLTSPWAQNYVGGFFGNSIQLAKQCAGISTTILLTAVMTTGLYALVHVVMLPFGGAWEAKEEGALKSADSSSA